MKKIWQKTDSDNLNLLIDEYCIGVDYLLDMDLIPYDIQGSIAHVEMLHSIDILTLEEKDILINGLNNILNLHATGEFKILKNQEDGHTAIESFLIETCGEVGKKVHTGRSRNDQVLVTTRLFTMDNISQIEKLVGDLCLAFENKITEIGDTIMPGYTHTQRAMPTTIGTWLGSFLDAIKDDLILLEAAKKINNQNPLGSVAGFGEDVFGLDKELTTSLLGFDSTQSNPMYCAYSRGKFEHIVLQALSQIMLDLGKLANDFVLFSSQEFDFLTLPDNFKTGSSVMPQKKNWDIMELIRGNTNLFHGYEYQVKEVYKNLLSGYNRDFQLTKEPYMKGISLVKNTIEVCDLVIQNLGVKQQNLESACSEELYATHEAYKLVKGGMTFRDAYKQVGMKYM